MNFQAANRILGEARQKAAMAASLMNDAHNMTRSVFSSGYKPEEMNALLPVVDDAVNSTERVISLLDKIRG